jgi:hypothetical protein
MSLEQGTILRCGVKAPERLPVYPLLRARVRWPKLYGACVTLRAVVLEASVPLAMGHVFARLILRLEPLQWLVRCRGIGRARVKRLIRFEESQGGVRHVAAALHNGRDNRLALEQPLKAGDAKGRFMPDQRGGQHIHGLAQGWTAELGDLGRSMPRGSRAKLAGGNPGSGPQFAHRGEARPVFDGGEAVGGSLRRRPWHTGQMSGRRLLHQGLELAGEVLDRLLVDVDARELALEQAPMHLWRRSGRDKRPLRGLLNRLGVLGPERTPMVREELDEIGSGQGQHVRRSWAHMQNMMAQLTRGRRLAQRLFLRVRKQEMRKDACDPG